MTERFKAIEYKGTIPRLYGIEDTTDELTIPLSCLNQRECLQITDLLNEQDQRIQELESLFPSKTCKWMDKENIAIRCDKYKDFRVCGVYKSCFEEGTWGDR